MSADRGPARIRVSVVMPVRNEGPVVEEALATMFGQTRPPDEIIVADGCSTDDTVERVQRLADRGVPVRVVRNESVFAGGGLNVGSAAAAHDLIVRMDFGNRAEPDWLAAMVAPFERDPELDYLGGAWFPILEGEVGRVCAAVVYHADTMATTMDRAAIERTIRASDLLPTGACAAYRRRIWQRAGGFCEWARKAADQLFSHRVRRLGGKIDFTLDAVVHHHMPHSYAELYDRFVHYGIWAGRTGLERHSRRNVKLLLLYGPVAALLVASVFWPWALVPASGMLVLYFWRSGWRKLAQVGAATGQRFSFRDHLRAPAVLMVRDAAVLVGSTVGSLDRLLRRKWRRMTEAYLERGEQRPRA